MSSITQPLALGIDLYPRFLTLTNMPTMLSHVWFFATQWTINHQAPLSMEFFQARILEWVTTAYSKRSSQCRDRNSISCIGRQILSKHKALNSCFIISYLWRVGLWGSCKIYKGFFWCFAFIFFLLFSLRNSVCWLSPL